MERGLRLDIILPRNGRFHYNVNVLWVFCLLENKIKAYS